MNQSTKRKFFCFVGLIGLVSTYLFTAGCSRAAEEVSLKHVKPGPSAPSRNDTLKIAISAIISPKKTFIYYREILDYIAEKTGSTVELVQRETYAEVNDLVENNEITAAFVCSGAYVEGHRKFGMQLLLAPIAYGEPFYYSYIIVPTDSNSRDFEDLRGKRFAFTDPMSNSGKLAPTYTLFRMGEKPQTFFSDTIFTYSHDKSIEAVAQKLVDGAAVDSLIWDYADATNPEFTSKTRIISRSSPFGIPPVVVPKELDPAIRANIRKILLEMHLNIKGRNILRKVKIDQFIEIEDSAYDSIREMRKFVDG